LSNMCEKLREGDVVKFAAEITQKRLRIEDH